jgi:hypothetical protein
MGDELVTILTAAVTKTYEAKATKRDAHPKSPGTCRAVLKINPDEVPQEARIGLFAKAASFDAWVRFSNADASVRSDAAPDIRGMAVKLMSDIGANKSAGQDFLTISTPNLSIATVRLFYVAVYYVALKNSPLGLAWRFLITGNIGRLLALKAAEIKPTSLLDVPYWSVTPYKLGDSAVVKYKFVPTSKRKSPVPATYSDTYLTQAMEAHLDVEDASFDLRVQFQKDPTLMPIEDSSVLWDEAVSPFVTVATLTIPKQKFNTEENIEMSEVLSFSPGNARAEHEGLGGINRVRTLIYARMQPFRHERAGRPNVY